MTSILSKEQSSGTVLGVERSASGVRWTWRTQDERLVQAYVQQLSVSPTLARVLIGRDVALEEADNFLNPSLKRGLPNPSHLLDMDKAAERFADAILKKEIVGVLGDYDVDGATSSALLVRYLMSLGIETHVYIPDRMKDGYGPNEKAMDWFAEKKAKLVMTVDCGATAHAPLAYGSGLGLEVIVLDHHLGAAELPKAYAVVNPNRLDESSEHTYLAAVGVTFLFLVAVNRILRLQGFFASHAEPDLKAWLDLVALGTVCDVVPLKGANRAFVAQGLKAMGFQQNMGLRHLSTVARITPEYTCYHAGFMLGPRINAGGRVGESGLGVRLLTLEDESEVQRLAEQLNILNAERQAIELMVLEQALEQAERQLNRALLMLEGAWHAGVVGIVAGRLKEKYQRPVAVIAHDGEMGKASARSVHGVDFGAAVGAARTEGLVVTGGGHAMAAGFTVRRDGISRLHDYFETRLSEAITRYGETRSYRIDDCVAVTGINVSLSEELAKAAPYGMGNPEPRIVVPEVFIMEMDILKDAHIRMQVTGKNGGGRLKCMAFRAVGTPLGDFLLQSHGKPMHLAGTVRAEFWNGKNYVTLHVEDAAVT
ncbi:MAG: single-stranded-DNA-specific exonuclease RecJ [Rickettsiales bacterium]